MTQTLNQLTERRAFLLAQVLATQTGGIVRIDIPVDAPIATNKETRHSMEFAPENKGKWRWPAGGVGMILKLRDTNVLLALHRDKGAPSYGGHNTLSSGLGSSVREMLYPLETAWREGAEELCIVTPDAIVCPIPETDHFGFGLELSEVTRGTANLFPKLADKPVVDVTTSFLPLSGEQQVVINYAGKTRTTKGLVVFDPNANGIDLLKAVVVPVDCTLVDLEVYDGELAGKKLLNREVYAYELDENFRPTGKIVRNWQYGVAVREIRLTSKEHPDVPSTYEDATTIPMTPVLKALYDALTNQ